MRSKFDFTYILLSFLLLISNKTNAQSPDWLWAKAMGGANNDNGMCITVDAIGNVYTIGVFMGTSDFDPGVGVFNLTSAGYNDIFISKLDNSGNFVWAKRIGGVQTDWGNAISTDSYGNVYTTGLFNGTVDFDPGIDTFYLTGNADIFISKLDSSGNFIWAKSMEGLIGPDIGRSITLDALHNVYTVGEFNGTVDFDPGIGIFNLTSAGGSDIFISKLDSSGNFIWAKQLGGKQPSLSNLMALDATGNVYTTGYFTGTEDFDPGVGTYNLTATSLDIFISKLDSSGNFIWAKQMGSATNSDEGYSISVDVFNNVYTIGYFRGTADFDPGVGTYNLTAAGGSDIFISKLDSSGNFIWAKAIGNINNDVCYSLALDSSGNVYMAGYFVGTVDFDPDSLGIFSLTSAGGYSYFVLKLDSSGNFIWAKAITATNNIAPLSLALDAWGKEYLMGSFYQASAIFGSITIQNTSVSGYSDVFIAKLDNIITGIETIEYANGISVYPNPATSHLTIILERSNKEVAITITDITGKIIYTTVATEIKKIEISTKDFADGVYVVQFRAADFMETIKLIVVK